MWAIGPKASGQWAPNPSIGGQVASGRPSRRWICCRRQGAFRGCRSGDFVIAISARLPLGGPPLTPELGAGHQQTRPAPYLRCP